jgi:hypothetical protein
MFMDLECMPPSAHQAPGQSQEVDYDLSISSNFDSVGKILP